MHLIIRLSIFAPVLLVASIGVAAYGQGTVTTNGPADRTAQSQASDTMNKVKTTVS